MRLPSLSKDLMFQVFLLACFAGAVLLLMVLDLFNLEKMTFFNINGFMFALTWKGRMFLLFFLLFVAFESVLFAKASCKEQEQKPRSHFRSAAAFVVALAPLLFIIGVNMGLDQAIIGLGEFRLEYWQNVNPNWWNSLNGDWPMCFEYLAFGLSFTAAMLIAYGKRTLRAFSISIAFILMVTLFYFIDTVYPYGAFAPLQVFSLPTSMCAASLLESIGIRYMLYYSSSGTAMPIVAVNAGGASTPTSVAWPCAGVHSMLIYAVFSLLILHRMHMSGFRKLVYFIAGAAGTLAINTLRIASFFVILVNQGKEAAATFHSVYGELLFFGWMSVFFALVFCIEKYFIVEKATGAFAALAGKGASA